MRKSKKLPPPPGQLPVGSYFKPMNYWQDSTILQNPDPRFRYAAVQCRMEIEKLHGTWNYLGTIGEYCYYCDYDCLEYHAYSPLHHSLVGKLNIEEIDFFIVGIDVIQNFQKKQIGTNLIRFANHKVLEQYGRDILAIIAPECRRSNFPEGSYLTDEGRILINSCHRRGILKHDQLIGNTPDPSSGSEAGSSPRRRRHRSPQRYNPY